MDENMYWQPQWLKSGWELERFIMAEGECHISNDEVERLRAENKIMRDFCHSRGITDGDINLAVAER